MSATGEVWYSGEVFPYYYGPVDEIVGITGMYNGYAMTLNSDPVFPISPAGNSRDLFIFPPKFRTSRLGRIQESVAGSPKLLPDMNRVHAEPFLAVPAESDSQKDYEN